MLHDENAVTKGFANCLYRYGRTGNYVIQYDKQWTSQIYIYVLDAVEVL